MGRTTGRSASWFATGIPLVTMILVAASLALPEGPLEVGSTLSASETQRIDSDEDGLTDFQESILGTDPDAVDSDGDTFTDLEEVARNSDPLDHTSAPGAATTDVGMYASARNGLVSLNSAVFVPPGELLQLSYYFGAIIEGEAIVLPGSQVASSSQQWVFPAREGGHLAVVEFQLPEWMIHYVGKVSFFSGATTGDPLDPDAPRGISSTTLTSISDTVMSINPISTLPIPPSDGGSASGGGGGSAGGAGGDVGGGVWYKPLTGDDEVPAELTSGEVCIQTVQFVGTLGANDVYEVSSASCEPMDSYCSSSSCTAAEGTALEIPNPGVIFGD